MRLNWVRSWEEMQRNEEKCLKKVSEQIIAFDKDLWEKD